MIYQQLFYFLGTVFDGDMKRGDVVVVVEVAATAFLGLPKSHSLEQL